MKKLVLLLLLVISCSLYAQDNLGVERGRYFIGTDPSNISQNAKEAFDDDINSTAFLYTNQSRLGVIFWDYIDVDSITVHFISQNGSCANPVNLSYVGLDNSIPPYSWETQWQSIGSFTSSCTSSSYTFDVNIIGEKGLWFNFEMTSNQSLPHIYELQIWGRESTVNSIEDEVEIEDEVIKCYDLSGKEVKLDKPGLVIVKWKSGKIEKRFNQ